MSKSVGTAVAAAYAGKYGLRTANIFFTPVEQTFPFVKQKGIVFHGTGDPWAATEPVRRACREKDLPLYLTEGADHSLETGNVRKDLETLRQVMETCRQYIASL